MNTNLGSGIKFPPRYRGYLALGVWGVIALLLLRNDPYALEEGAAKSLLLSWSIADQVASSVITFGTPDLRALFFLPIGFLWTGSIFAAKVLTVISLAGSAWLLYGWRQRSAGAESALLACGLLLIAPITLEQIDSLATGSYLLLALALGSWFNDRYRTEPRAFGGWYFVQLLTCAFSVSLHPAGLAYPLALIWSLRAAPLERRQQKFFLAGVIFTSLFILLLRMGWGGVEWFRNPLASLGTIFVAVLPEDDQPTMLWLSGGLALLLLAAVILKQWRSLLSDLTGRSLLTGLLLGALVGDQAWASFALAIILFFGLPILLRSGQLPSEGGFLRQRGWALTVVFIGSTIFMQADRARYEIRQSGVLTPQDQLIRTLANEAALSRKAGENDEDGKAGPRFIVASQWPSRTMIACKCDTLPLPPAAQDPQAQLATLKGISHLVLDPKQTANLNLARNLSLLGGEVETVSLQPGGVLLHVREKQPN